MVRERIPVHRTAVGLSPIAGVLLIASGVGTPVVYVALDMVEARLGFSANDHIAHESVDLIQSADGLAWRVLWPRRPLRP
jgi:hypothetical protein